MTRDEIDLLREWILAEIDAKIADSQPGSDGYYGAGYAENVEAKRLYEKVLERLAPSA